MDSTNGIYDNHLRQKQIWKAPNSPNSNDTSTNKEILHFIRKPSDLASSNANTNGESEKKPPILPNRTSVVINLDKNRIRASRRSRLLPRPLSLPSSFSLLKNLKQNQDNSAKEASLDISLIKKLEDEIYQRKEDILRQNENVINKKLCDNVKCTSCAKSQCFVPNRIVETKTFVDDTSAFNDPKSRPVLLVDSSQLQPLLMKRDRDSKSECVAGAKSIVIVDNSQYYPVLMTYEIKENTDNDVQSKVIQKPSYQTTKPPAITKKPTESSKQTRHFSHLFESCFCKSNPPSPIPSPPTTNYPSSTRSTISTTSSSTSSSLCSNVVNDDKNMSSRKSSKFKRFLIHRRSLNLPSSKSHHRSDETEMTGGRVKDKKKFICADIPNMYATPNKCVPDFRLCHDDGDGDVQFTNFEYKLKNNKLKWLLSIRRTSKTNSPANNSAGKRRWLSCEAVNLSHKSVNYLSIYCEAFHDIHWSYEDVNDIRHNQSKNIAAHKQQLDGFLNDDGRNEDIMKITTPPDCNGNNLVRRVRRRSSFRNKRHSVGSTDVVKTWIYRKR